jgi:DNA repair protein RadC
VFDRFRGRFAGAEQEEFVVVLLNNKNRVIRDVRASLGTLNTAPVHPRECFKEAIRESAASVIFLHNHPSGDPSPSRQDDAVTKRLREAGEIVGIPVLDHIIIGRDSFFSYADAGRL